jgi:hypothetical protein
MGAGQLKSCQIVIETGWFPRRSSVTGFAIVAEIRLGVIRIGGAAKI